MKPDIKQAEAAHRHGNLAEATALYEVILKADPEDVDALYGLGTVALQENDIIRARDFFARAAARQPDAADIAVQLASCFYRLGQQDDARTVARHAARNCGTDEPLSRHVSQLLLALNQPGEALAQLTSFPHRHTESLLLHARCLGALGHWDQAVSLLRQTFAERQEANVAEALSHAAGQLRDYFLAIDAFAGYLQLVQPTATDHLRFADLYLLARDPSNSRKQLDRAAELGAVGAEFSVLLAKLERLDGNYLEARDAADQALILHPGHGQAWGIRIERADDEELAGLVKKVRHEIEAGKAQPYHKSLMCYATADGYRRLGNLEVAFRFYAVANQLQKTALEARQAGYSTEFNRQQTASVLGDFSHIGARAASLNDHPVPIFILGMPRSGTTLVERMLAQLDNVITGGENEALGFLATQYQRDVRAGRKPAPGSMSADQWLTLARLYFERSKRSLGARVNPAISHITDKMPHNFNHVGMILSMFPRARVLQLRRDPRDVCLSIYTRSFPDGHSYACSFDSLAHAYRQCEELMDHWAELSPDQVLDVHYEQLVADPRQVGKQIVEFCGLDWRERCLEFYKDVSPSFTFSEMQVRKAVSDQPVGRWREVADHLRPLIESLHQQGCLPDSG